MIVLVRLVSDGSLKGVNVSQVLTLTGNVPDDQCVVDMVAGPSLTIKGGLLFNSVRFARAAVPTGEPSSIGTIPPA